MTRAAFAAGLVLLSACSSKTESLVVVSLTTATPTASASQVTLTASRPSCRTPPCADSVAHTFAVPALSSTPVRLGLYLPESVTGPISVSASVDAHACAGYAGATNATVSKPGERRQPQEARLLYARVRGDGDRVRARRPVRRGPEAVLR